MSGPVSTRRTPGTAIRRRIARESGSITQISWSVPTPDELNGNFAYGGRSGVNAIYDPRTTTLNNGVGGAADPPAGANVNVPLAAT